MKEDVRDALRRALRVCELLMPMPMEEQRRLFEATAAAELPTRKSVRAKLAAEGVADEEIEERLQSSFAREVRRAYARAAKDAGFSERHGTAALEYVAMLHEIGEG